MNRSSKIPKSLGVGGLFKRKPLALPLLLATLSYPLINVEAATKITAPKAKFDAKLQKVVVTGKTSGSAPFSQLSIYDPTDHRLLFSGQTNAKSAFNFSFPQNEIPCLIELELGDASVAVKVTGANPAKCKVSAKQIPVPGTPSNLACSIKGSNRVTTEGTDQSFEIFTKSRGLSFDWDFGDGNQASNKQNINHAYSNPGLYKVKATGLDSAGLIQCTDSITVSVTPPAGTNIHAPVAETSATPNLASAMPGKNGENDTNAIVVFPFEDMGMEGGSQINIPFNPLVPYNALNAQVLQKIPNKPKLLDSTNYQVTYSAAANPKDPAGAGSINSTSQNYFQGNKKGSNFDYAATDALNLTTKETKYLEDQAYDKALIAKTEFWDKIRQPNATKIAKPTVEKGLSQGDTQNTYVPAKPLVKPDEGLRGYVDKGAGVRAMPGIAAPYEANDAQPMDYSESQQSFVAQNIPATSIDDQGKTNPYPLMRVEVKEGNNLKTAIDAVYTTASETGCRTCHIKGEKGSDDTVWRTPVTINELLNPDGSPGPATGKGAFPPENPTTPVLTGDIIADFKKYGYGPAVHNLFDGKFPLNPNQAMVESGITLQYDANGIRTDRVAESRWLKPDGTTSATNPDKIASWKLQIRLKFKDAADYGENSWQNQEKAARWNTMLLHDYMTPINYNNARDDIFAEWADDIYKGSRTSVTMCASHHTSTLKQDTGAAAVSQVRTLSDWTRTTHAFHGKMQVYKQDVAAAQSPDKLAHKKGELIRDERGHPIMWGGRGWDTIDNDKNRLPMTKDANGNFTVPAAEFLPNARNNWKPDLFPPHPLGQEMLPVGENIDMDNNCLTCHTGKTEKSYRDIHHAAGMKCDSCHGGMLAVGLTYPNEIYDGNRTMAGALGNDDPATLTAPDFRRAWLDEPDCGSCHVGDANLDKDGEAGLKHYFSAGALKQGWLDEDKSAASIHPVNARFAVMPSVESRPEKLAATDADVAAGLAAKKGDTIYKERDISQSLYRKSGDVHGSGGNGILNCSTCHGGSHGIWPNKDPNANDNVTAKQLQGYDGNIAECSTCHIKDDFKTGLVATDGGDSGLGVAQGKRDGIVVSPAALTKKGNAFLAGPHGMHPVGDEYWYKHAEGAAKNTSKGKHKANLNGGWHNDMAAMPGPDGEDQCAACHGADHKGTRLSRTLVDRVLINAKGKAIKVAKDTVIGCNLCHSLDKSFASRPQGGWKEPKLHHAPLPEAVTSNPNSGGSSPGHG